MGNISRIQVKKHEANSQNSVSNNRTPCCSKTRSSLVDRVLFLQRTVGNQVVQSLMKSGTLQANLRIGQPGDKYEQEADRVADAVMKMPEPLEVSSGTPHIQRLCPKCEGKELKGQSIKEKEANPGFESHIQSLKGGGRSLSINDRAYFEPRFGLDLGQIRLHTDNRAAESARAVNARAFTIGKNVVFGAGQFVPETASGKRLLAHELTHVIQQGGHDKTSKDTFSSAAYRIQRYTDYDSASQTAGISLGWTDPSNDPLMVSDDGTMAVKNLSHGTPNKAWSSPNKIKTSEGILKSQNSKIKLVEGANAISGKAPKRKGAGANITLKEVKVENRVGGGYAGLTADCGTTARQVMGIPGSSEKFVGVTKKKGVESYTAGQLYHGNPYTTPDRWSEEIFKREFGAGLTRAEALKKYDDLSTAEKDKFDKKYGINKYAKPKVGQGITINTESDMPGWTPTSPDDWNFHFAGTILTGDQDYVTLENYPGTGRNDSSWFFWMYGPYSKKQSFHDIHGAYGHGDKYTTMVTQPEKLLLGKTSSGGVHLVADPAQPGSTLIARLPKGTELKVIRKGVNWRKVEVTSGPHTGKIGWILNSLFEVK